MRRKRLLLVLVVFAMMSTMVFAAGASADVDRCPAGATFTFTLVGINTHTYDVTFDCEGNFTGTGPGTGWGPETITGTMVDGNVTFTAVYIEGGPNGNYQWGTPWGAGPLPLDGTAVMLGDNMGAPLDWPVIGSISIVEVKNHGQYVKGAEKGERGRSEAARSCIGKPIKL